MRFVVLGNLADEGGGGVGHRACLSLRRPAFEALAQTFLSNFPTLRLRHARSTPRRGPTRPRSPGYCAEARESALRRVVLIEAVPKTSVGKFDKKVLRERFKGWTPKG